MIDVQRFGPSRPDFLAISAKTTKKPADAAEIPDLLWKGWLVDRFRLRGSRRYRRLRERFLTDAVCRAAGFEYDDWKGKSLLPRDVSLRLAQILGL